MEDKLQAKINQGQKAEALLRNEAFAAACKTVEAGYIKEWAGTLPRDKDAREVLWISLQVLGEVIKHIHSAHQDGKIAAKDLDEMIKKGRQAA